MERLDADLVRVIEELRQKAGGEQFVHVITGDYTSETASYFLNQVGKAVFEDVDLIEENIGELEQALAGVVVIRDRKGKPRNLVTTGRGRLINAENLLQSLDTVVARYGAGEGTGKLAEKLRIRVAEVRAWVQKVQIGYDRYAASKKRR